jgi:hypothetical protein
MLRNAESRAEVGRVIEMLRCMQSLAESGMLRNAESHAGVDRVWNAAVRT